MLGSQAVVSVDPCFTDFFGFKSEELLGAQLDDWLVATEAARRSVVTLHEGCPSVHLCTTAQSDWPAGVPQCWPTYLI
jgi:hypothetical protein